MSQSTKQKSKSIKAIAHITPFSQFEDRGETRYGSHRFVAKFLIQNFEQDVGVPTPKPAKINYYGHHPPEDINTNKVYKCKLRIKKNEIGSEFQLINNPDVKGPELFELLEKSDDTHHCQYCDKSYLEEKMADISDAMCNGCLEENENPNIVEKFKVNPELSDFGKLAKLLVNQGKISKEDIGPLDPIEMVQTYYPELEKYILDIPVDDIEDYIAKVVEKIYSGEHPSLKNHNDEKKVIDAKTDKPRSILEYIENNLGIDSEEEEDQLSDEEIQEAITEKKQEDENRPDDLTRLDHVGDKTAEELRINAFDSFEVIADTSEMALSLVDGIGKATAGKIISSAKLLLDIDDQTDPGTNEQVTEETEEPKEDLQTNLGDVDPEIVELDLEEEDENQSDKEEQDDKEPVGSCTGCGGELHIDNYTAVCQVCYKPVHDQNCVDLCHEQPKKEEELDKNEYLANNLRSAVLESINADDSLSYVPGYLEYRASWSSSGKRKIYLLKRWRSVLSNKQRTRRQQIIDLNNKTLGAAKMGTIIHEYLETSEVFEQHMLSRGWEIIEKEEKISFEIEHPAGYMIKIVGHIDVVFRHIETGEVLVTDYKSRNSRELREQPIYYSEKLIGNKKQLLNYQTYKGKEKGSIIELGRDDGEVDVKVFDYNLQQWEDQKEFWFELATLEVENQLPEKCSQVRNKFPCSWDNGKHKCQFFGFCWEDDH